MKLNAELDIGALAEAFRPSGRLQIPCFLDPADAGALHAAFADIPWRLVLNEGDAHFDILPEQLAAMTKIQLAQLGAGATLRSKSAFQYIYRNYPVFDIVHGSGLMHAPLQAAYSVMNAPETIALLGEITGTAASFCDMQATRYEAGHFLTEHDDDVAGKHRQFAYVLSLCPDWKAGWGGLLQFPRARGSSQMLGSFVPDFNTLSIFRVPMLHRVSPVASHARIPRDSLTGWYRLHPDE